MQRASLTVIALLLVALAGCKPTKPVADSATADTHLKAGIAATEAGRGLDAVIEFTKAIEVEESAAAYSNRGLAYHQLGHLAKAKVDHDKALALDPGHAEVRHNRALLLIDMKRSDVALSEFTEAIRLAPAYSAAYAARGTVNKSQGDYAAALMDFRQAVDMNPNDLIAHNDLAWLLATCPDDSVRGGGEAVKHATKARELADWQTLDTLAAAFAESGEFGKAAQAQQLAIDAAPDDRRSDLESRLMLYQANKPYRTSAKD